MVEVPVNESCSFHSLKEPEAILGRSFYEIPSGRILAPGVCKRNSVIVAYIEMLNRGKQEGKAHKLERQAALSRTQPQTNSRVRLISRYRGLSFHPWNSKQVIRVGVAEVGKERLQSESAHENQLAGHSIQNLASELVRTANDFDATPGRRRIVGPRDFLGRLEL